MNEINEGGMNPRISGAPQAHQVEAPALLLKERDRMGMYLNNVLGQEGGTTQTSVNLDAVMSGCLNGYLGLGENAMASLENPLASAEILNPIQHNLQSAQAVPPPIPMEQSNSLETLAGFNVSEVSQVALGLIPGLGMDVAIAEKSNPVAVSEVLDKSPAAEVGMNLQQKMAVADMETLAAWEMDFSGEIAALENLGAGGLAVNKVNNEALAQKVQPGQDFDMRSMVSNPVVEGNRGEYEMVFDQMHETLEGFETGGNNALVGVSDWLGEPIHNNVGVGLNENIPQSPLGLTDAVPVNQVMGYHSVVNKELLGFLDLSSYSQTMAMGVNPEDSVAMLKPGKYVSNLVDGYYT